MREHEFRAVIYEIRYKPGYVLNHSLVGSGISKVWWTFPRVDRDTGEKELGQSGEVLIHWSIEDSVESIVRQVFGMTKRLEEHEAREFFLYSEERPFDPHKQLIERKDMEWLKKRGAV